MNRRTIVLLGLAATIGFAGLWHGPLGAGERLASDVETTARRTLDYYELPMIQAKLQRGPLSRRLILSGPADDFQRSELVRMLDETPGVLEVRWDPASLPQETGAAR
ncbi:hypothetical protein LZ496_09680 [Sphingomonas sp. NSE70-1]|uniref:BON domain-containing protein n=1 Tax=Sphingomonas caseinilyticus TaxID=2908205 RepID=A0ABT0RVI2_9SPHN|nr:hypothetical protein [Sphingomonas caseinilyticus]MCL6699049.1 hypothetical protein [Sphingomonas caseinilyticus]